MNENTADCRVLPACVICDQPNCNGKKHDSSTVYKYPCCENCGIELNDIVELISNPELRNKQSCEICGSVYKSGSSVNTHFLSHFIKESTLKLFCFYCQSMCHTESSSRALNARSDTDLVCDLCEPGSEKVYKVEYGLLRHKKEKHGVDTEYQYEFACPKCPRKFESVQKLGYHKARMHRKKRVDPDYYYCRVCEDEKWINRSSRTIHENNEHRNPETNMYDCTYCERSYTCISFLQLHLLMHTKKKNHVCDICGKGFGRSTHLGYHVLTHAKEKVFECNLCTGKSFKTEFSLKRHMVYMHTDQKRYECEHCDRWFKDPSDRRRHRWSHGGYEKRFQCLICDKKFYENKTLRYHMRTHEKKSAAGVANRATFIKSENQ